ncbi:LigB subunit of an aromatic-ring-opening dioxygenase LigAB [Cryphonectria parasitica EP155]|uniref:LigB subunit of an aromatic-ring-opening dioxygenase LigAB n=1 Tax=Cryphonectria parasitica (strain ATCC 38755 / EP155) TaxID=660469 RepID=A0A9P5CTK0_CRYP1|nr:LigB subunit of an aromatic-ring-opening dioxygenase LigAB [Cryphonectria parasitica EP155]KAF3770719.1 LigB subunit of an aromatic-ring-opening dioxygenase LigAB [Cryphonectria parasitica EP155]
MAPVHFFSHGSTMMLGEDSASARYWERMGDQAVRNGVEHVIMMGAHWATTFDGVLISANPHPGKNPVAFVHPSKYEQYRLNPDLAMVSTIQSHLSAAGIASKPDETFDWIHDTYLVLIRMFPKGCPPTTIISSQHRYDPHFHMAVGAALRPLRDWDSHKVLFIGSGGAVHNLYRNVWTPMLRYRDNFAQPTPPEAWAMDFRQEVMDAFVAGNSGVGGPRLRRKMTALMKHPKYREAHATDDHFMSSIFVAGLCGDKDDEGMRGELGAEDWELTNMCNSQFTIGSWED